MKIIRCGWLVPSGKVTILLLLAACVAIGGVAEAAKGGGGGKPGDGGGGGGGGKVKLPVVSVSPLTLDFASVQTSTSSTRAVTVSNSGRADLIVSNVSGLGAPFSQLNDCLSRNIAPGGSCMISVTFTPASAGPASDSLVIDSNDATNPSVAVHVQGDGVNVVVTVRRVEGAGDSIMRGYNASCRTNTGLFDFLCYGGGDQDQNSYLDGSSSSVTSVVDRYRVSVDSQFTGSKAASASGSEMTDMAKNNFATQADAIVAAASQPAHVFVELGGNDLCNRGSVGELYDDAKWESAVRAGLDRLVTGMPGGSTVLLVGVPRVQDLRAVGIEKQNTTSGVNCENFWASFDVCRIATAGGSDLVSRLGAVGERQRAYNEKLVLLAGEYNALAEQTGVEVVAEYEATANESVGSYGFLPDDINGGDCFHPSIQGQNKLSEIIWRRSPGR